MPTLLVTGANRGLGLEFVRQYAADGWNVVACCRSPDKARELQDLAKSNPHIRIEALDVSQFDAFDAFARRVKDIPVDLLVNNAGILTGKPGSRNAAEDDPSQIFGSIDGDAWDRILRVNSISPILLTQRLLPNLLLGKERKVVMISSGWGSTSGMGPEYMAYRSSKAALNNATANVALHLAPHKIIAVSMAPGWVSTDMGGPSASLTPEESISSMKATIAKLSLRHSGQFLRHDGGVIPW